MIPLNQFTNDAVVSPLLPPGDSQYEALVGSHRGGVALSDASKGRNFQTWTARYQHDRINLYPEAGGEPVFSLVVANVLSVSLAFDNNMHAIFAYQTASGSNLYFYDTLTEGYSTLSVSNTTSCQCCVDDVRDLYIAASDVVFAYIRSDSVLCYRLQRERYLTEHVVGQTDGGLLVRVGQSQGRRLTFQIKH